MTEQEALKDFFISYNKADRAWAEWIAHQLREAGYTEVYQAADFRPGGNFVLQMQDAIINSKRILAVLSPDYLDPKAGFSHAEWAAAFVDDPEGRSGRLIPVRVRECKPPALLASITYIDLVGKSAAEARNELIAGIDRSRNLPQLEPLFPGEKPPTPPQTPDFPGAWPIEWNVPYNRNRLFTGREELLQRLHDSFTATRSEPSIQIKALSGLAGVGKTQVALQYAHRYGHEYRSVLWVSAVTNETLDTGIVQLATALKLPEASARDPREAIDAVKRWLAQQKDWLLILDNAEDPMVTSRVLHEGARTNGQVLITTRTSAGRAQADIIEIEQVNPDEGALLLLRRIGTLASDASLEQASEQSRLDAEDVVSKLGGLPLAIDQAGAYIEERATTVSGYLKLYRTRHADLLRMRGRFSSDHPESVATTFSLSFQKVEQDNPHAANLLRLFSFLAPDTIPEALLTEGTIGIQDEVLVPLADPIALGEATGVLLRFSFVRRSWETSVISVHRLVQVTLKDVMEENARKQWAHRTVLIVNTALPKVNFQRFDLYQEYFAHAQVATDLINEYQLSFLEAAQLLYKVGWYLREQGKYEQAGTFYERALAICKKELGLQHRETAAAMEGRGTIYFHLGKYKEAQELLEQALAAHEHIAGAELDKGVLFNNLANLYQVLGEYEKAEGLLRRALAHEYETEAELERAVVLSNLANLYLVRGQYEGAEEFLRQALDIHERVASEGERGEKTTALEITYPSQNTYTQPDLLLNKALRIQEKELRSGRPSTIATLLYFANLYQARAKYKEAESLYRHALNIQEQTFGLEHPSAGGILQGLADLYQAQGQNEEAEQLYTRSITLQETALGLTHPNLIGPLQGLASLYQAQGKYEQAEQLYQRTLDIVMQLFGPDHVNTGGVLQRLASFYQAQKRYSEAEQLYKHTLGIVSQAFGPEHTNTGGVLQGLASLYQAEEKPEEAEKLYLQAIDIQEKALGKEHPSTGWVLQGLADLYQAQRRYKEAEELDMRNLNIQQRALGTEHVYIGWIVQRLANLYQAQGKYEQAELAYQNALHIQEKATGPEQPETLGIAQELANLYVALRKYEQAESLYRRILESQEKNKGPEHADTATALYSLGRLYQLQEQYKDACHFYQRSWRIFSHLWGTEDINMDYRLQLQKQAEQREEQKEYKEAALLYQHIMRVEGAERLHLFVGLDLVHTFDPEEGGIMLKRIQDIRHQLVEEQGFILPSIRIQDSLNIDKNEYEVLLDGKSILRRKIPSKAAFLKSNGSRARRNEIETREPGYDLPVLWVTSKPEGVRKRADHQLLSVEDIICANLKKAFIEHQETILE